MQVVLTPLLWLAVATVVLSAFASLAQKDLKRIFAYSSINHLGYCLLGIFAVAKFTGGDASLLTEKFAATSGVLLQMFNHGLTAAAIFWFIAMLEARSGGLRSLDDFGGIRKVAPVFAGLMGVALFSSLGLPGLNGFIGEFLIFKGSFPLTTWASSLCVIGLMITAVVILGVIQRVFSGPLNERWIAFPDLSTRERLSVMPVIGLMFVLGVYPQLILGLVNGSVIQMVQQLKF
jgi:NADH-quinone oxidoreductase subunit M